jgi:hypothetical protein
MCVVGVCALTYVGMFVWVCLCGYVCVCVDARLCMSLCASVRTHVYVRVCTCAHVCVLRMCVYVDTPTVYVGVS